MEPRKPRLPGVQIRMLEGGDTTGSRVLAFRAIGDNTVNRLRAWPLNTADMDVTFNKLTMPSRKFFNY